ncbi:MAG: hypothetical protein ABSF70_08650 [Terracidiphilus sp.]
MLETLAGKLKWERTGNGIRVELPAQLTWPNVSRRVGSWLFTWAIYFALITLMDGFRGRPVSWRVALIGAPFYAACGIWDVLRLRTVLTLNPDEMTINQAFFQKNWTKRIYATRRLDNLRYCKSRLQRTAERREVKNSLLCDVEHQTIGLFDGVDEEEADALIAKMMEVFPFPKYLSIESATGAEANNTVPQS